MPLSAQEQIKNQIENSENILILTGEKPTGDSLASSWGLFHLLKSLGKNPTVLSSDAKDSFSFLKQPEKIEKEIRGARDFIISFNTARNKIINVKTENKDEVFEIIVTPEKETIDPRDFSFIPAKFKYDLVVVLGCSDLEKLGGLKEKNADLFFEVPIINIDSSSDNENFGQINLVEIKTSSLAETLSGLSKTFWEKHLGKDASQCFLAGIISATANFQNNRTTPKTFTTASWLIEKGADQQEIIRHIFKTQSFPFIKLWGRVMARLNWDEKLKLAWSLVSLEDFIQSRSNHQDLPLILDRIKDNFSKGKIFVTLYSETLKKNIALIKTADYDLLKNIQKACNGEIKGNCLEIIYEGKNILEAEKELMEKLRSINT